MALTEPKPLPLKLKLASKINAKSGETYEDLNPEDRAIFDAYYEERDRRNDPSVEGVAQEALDCKAWLVAQRRSPSEAFEIFGFSNRSTMKPAEKEEARLVKELAVKVVADIVPNTKVALIPEEVRVAKDIPEYVKPVEPEPVVVEK